MSAFEAHGRGNSLLWRSIDNYGVATVEVLGRLNGNGTLVLVNDELRILTNSHLLMGAEQVKIRLAPLSVSDSLLASPSLTSRWPRQTLQAAVVADFKVEDVALLKIQPEQIDASTYALLTEIARQNIQFCTSQNRQCPKSSYRYADSTRYRSQAHINFLNLGEFRKIDVLSFLNVIKTPDEFISGINQSVLMLPIFARRGMSGAPVYINGQFRGMLTKVSLSGGAYSFAIPIEDIAVLLSEGSSNFVKNFEATWNLQNQASKIILHDAEHKIEWLANGSRLAIAGDVGNGGDSVSAGDVGNGGDSVSAGDVGNGGDSVSAGDVGNGGDSSMAGDVGNGGNRSHQSFWNFTIKENFGAETEAEMSNPFSVSGQGLFIDGQRVHYFKMPPGRTHAKTRFLAATLSRYLFLKKHSEIKGWQLITESESSHAALKEARIHSPRKPNRARVYIQNSETAFRDIGGGFPRSEVDNSQLMLPDSKDISFSKQFARQGRAPAPIPGLLAGPVNNDLGSFNGFPFKAWDSFEDILKVELAPSLEWNDRIPMHTTIKIPRSLDRVIISCNASPFNSKKNCEDEVLLLNPTSSLSSLSFENQATRSRAIVIFFDSELSEVERIFVQSHQLLFEFVSCTPGKECFR